MIDLKITNSEVRGDKCERIANNIYSLYSIITIRIYFQGTASNNLEKNYLEMNLRSN